MQVRKQLDLFIIIAVSLIALTAAPAWSHVFPLRSDPRVGSEVKAPPSSIRIWFDGPLEPIFSEMKLFNGSGKEVETDQSQVAKNDDTLLTLRVDGIGPGKYRVWWGVVGKDGHRTEGDFTFQIK